MCDSDDYVYIKDTIDVLEITCTKRDNSWEHLMSENRCRGFYLNVIDTIYMNSSWFPVSNNAAKLEVIIKIRAVEHDGYCSDAESDTGEYEYQRRYVLLSDYQLVELLDKIDSDGNVDLEILRLLYDTQNLGCQVGSGYCGYKGSIEVLSGKLMTDMKPITKEFLLEQALASHNFGKKVEDQLTLEAYLDFFADHKSKQIEGFNTLIKTWN